MYTAVLTAPEKFPLVIGMWPVEGMTAGGSRITFFGQHLEAFLDPLGAYFIPSNDTGLPPVYGFVDSRSEGFNWNFFSPQFALIISAGGGTKTIRSEGFKWNFSLHSLHES